MDFWDIKINPWHLYEWELIIDDWFFVAVIGLFVMELAIHAIKARLSWGCIGDAVASFCTLAGHLLIVFLVSGLYVTSFYMIQYWLQIEPFAITPLTIVIALVFADFCYYWEHRAAHRIALGWVTHTVHHSSPFYNLSVAYRHGPFDALMGLPFLLPMAAFGLDPFLIFFAATMVQLYQTLLHTEIVGKAPAAIEAIFNTPSHHRVHHGSNPVYLDKNYAGILIIWDRLFGTFAREEEKVIYGLVEPLNSRNPLIIFLHGFGRLIQKWRQMPRWRDKFLCCFMPPGWLPDE